MARALLVGCGCRGREVGKGLLAAGWAVRGTSRTEGGLEAITAAGIEPAIADPDRGGTIVELVGDVTVVAWLLGSARGSDPEVAAVNGPRLERVLEKLVDTPVRGFAYEAHGSAPEKALEAGVGIVEAASARWRIRVALLREDESTWEHWAAATVAAIRGLVGEG